MEGYITEGERLSLSVDALRKLRAGLPVLRGRYAKVMAGSSARQTRKFSVGKNMSGNGGSSGGGTATSSSSTKMLAYEEVLSMPVSQLKALLQLNGVSTLSCLERSDLVKAAITSGLCLPRTYRVEFPN
jgi:hypothetical protein